MNRDENNLTRGDIKQQMLIFALPMIVTSICQQIYQLTDTIIVGNFIGDNALAAVGACAPFVFLFIALSRGVSMGVSVIVGQSFGSKLFHEINRASNTLYVFIFFFSIFLTTLGILFSDNIMEVLNLPLGLKSIAIEYFNIYLLGLIFLFLSNSVMGLLISVGDSFTPMIFISLSVLVNIFLDIVMVLGLDLGVKGVAWATVITQALVVFSIFTYIHKKKSIIRLSKKIVFDKALFLKSLKIGIPSGIQQVIVGLGMVAIMAVINKFGVDVIAGYVAASRIEGFVMVVPMGLSSALTAFVAQNYGAKQYDRVKKGVNEMLKISFVTCLIILILLSIFGTSFMKLFSSNPNIINIGNQYLFIIGLSFVLFAFMFIFMGAMRGLGNAIVPMFISLFTFCLIRLPLAFILSSTYLHELGIWLASPVSWLLGVLFAGGYWYFKQIKKIQNIER
ncbi:MAG: MATE family efflux transporter [Bacteroidetes bacterium]|nr:MATE family efflux transporter [Bacteroidota bacterium]